MLSTTTYTFDNSDVQARQQLGSLQTCLDPITTRLITELRLPAGAQCWEVGAGAGSIGSWMAGNIGTVVATDINTSQLGGVAGLDHVTVIDHDVATLTPAPGGPFDLIHARLVLLHLPQREEILRMLADSLAPSGWLLLEEFDCSDSLYVYTATTDEAELFQRVTDAIIEVLETNGADMEWARRVYPAMREAGLRHVHTTTHTETWPGGSPGTQLHAANSHQLAPQLHDLGITDDDLHRFRSLLDDQAHAAASYELVSTRGQRA